MNPHTQRPPQPPSSWRSHRAPGLFQPKGWEERGCKEKGPSPIGIQLAKTSWDSAGMMSTLQGPRGWFSFLEPPFSEQVGPLPTTHFTLASQASWAETAGWEIIS